MPILIPKCEKCESEMILREKEGSKFWGCPNWQKCGGKTKPYAGVDKPSESTNNSIQGILARMEMKLDVLLDNVGLSDVKESKFIVTEAQTTTPLKDILASDDIPVINKDKAEDEIDPKDIPF